MKEKELIVPVSITKGTAGYQKIIQQSFLIYIQRELKDNAHNLCAEIGLSA